jgi:hypothetical protein
LDDVVDYLMSSMLTVKTGVHPDADV